MKTETNEPMQQTAMPQQSGPPTAPVEDVTWDSALPTSELIGVDLPLEVLPYVALGIVIGIYVTYKFEEMVKGLDPLK